MMSAEDRGGYWLSRGLDAAVLLLGPDRGHALLGCDWGTYIALPSDLEVCVRQATQRMVIHEGATEHPVKLCAAHAALVESRTDPHEAGR